MSKPKKIKRVAILTGGGDCPGLNAVIRAVVRSATLDYGWEVFGIEDAFEGLSEGRFLRLTPDSVAGILPKGGTILGTSNRFDPFLKEIPKKVERLFEEKDFDALFCVGGDGTMGFAKKFARRGLPIVGIPKTIDNDVHGTERTVGFYSAVHTATEAIDKLYTTAASHHRVMVIEVMGRDAGWLALASGLATGADIILIPEIPFDLKKIYERVRERSLKGRRFTIIVSAEGAHPDIGHWLAERIEKNAKIVARGVVLGHILRGGSPIYQDRILATTFGWDAVHRLASGEHGMMVAWGKGEHTSVSFSALRSGPRHVPMNHPWIEVCRSMGTTFAEAD